MKHLLLVVFIGFSISCQAQIPEDIAGYADVNFHFTESKSSANYYRIHKHIDHLSLPSINPNSESLEGGLFNEGYGTTFNPPYDSGVDYEEITFYDFNNTKVLTAKAIVEAENYELYGLATWFDKKGNKEEVGFYKNNIRGNLYETYDENGKITSKGYYVNGEKFTEYTLDERLFGTWMHKYETSGYFGQTYKRILFNKFYGNGSAQIWSEEDVDKKYIDYDPDVTNVHYSFEKTGANTGVLKTFHYFSGQVDEEAIKFVGKNKFISTITKHADQNLVGKSYEFTFTEG